MHIQNHIHQQQKLLLRIDDVIHYTGLSRSSIFAGIKTGSFPAPVRIGKRLIAWRSIDISTWVNSRRQAWEKLEGGQS